MTKKEPSRSRRDFIRALTFSAVAAPLPALAEDVPKADPLATTEADARMSAILQRFGSQLDESSRKEIRKDVEAMVERSEQLRKLSVDNSESPFPVFRPYRDPRS